MTISMQVAENVDESRLWQRHVEMAAHGARADGGVDRQALSAADIAARRQLIAWATDLELTCLHDAIGNLYVRLEGQDPGAAPVMTGSHLDSQPTGGKYDGTYGVLAGLEALQAIQATGRTPARPIEAVAWTNEEGSRFLPGCMGSGVMTGALALDDVLKAEDWDGVAVADALRETLAAVPALATREARTPVAYVEAHIEQGPVLEGAGCTIGAVTGIQGNQRYRVQVTGAEAHSGTTPRAARQDAVAAAAAMVTALYEATADDGDVARFTVGRFDVSPGAVNTVAGTVTFTIDLRHPEAAALAELAAVIAPTCERLAGRCAVTVEKASDTAPVAFDGDMVAMVERHAAALNLPTMALPSGAGHDAIHLAGVCPTAMVFVPCAGGVSHNPAESATPGDLAAGTRVLAACLAELAGLE